ncbi:MAG TPA: MBL fold metallo-hydrolase [Candidatus Dojkabacteria bacterium]|nr:MBL fold metallo-hydrolase [Candidatus Dojkabacteria bacterium]
MLKYIVIIIGVTVWLLSSWIGHFTDVSLKIFFLNIGQGDAILVKSPDNKYLLIDSGPDQTVLSELSAVMPFWIRTIDLVIATHPDADHIGGLLDISQRYTIALVLYNKLDESSQLAKNLKEFWQKQAIKVKGINADEDFTFGCCIFLDFLWPLAQADLSKLASNNASISFVLKYQWFSAFFGGDLSKKYEEQVAKNYRSKVNVLKVGHHGSKTSTSGVFLQIFQPQLAVISVGYKNRYGHPSLEVIKLLQDYSVKTLRTDEVDRIILTSDGRKFSVGFT